MGKVAEMNMNMNKKKKKKGRPSLLDLQKRSLRLQQKQQQQDEHGLISNPNSQNPNPPTPNSNPTRRSARRKTSPEPEWINDDDEDDERREKKLKLVVKLPSHLDHLPHPRSSGNSLGSDSNVDGENNEAAKKKRKINDVSDRSGHASTDKGEKFSKATDTPHGSGSRLDCGPTTPLPDKKLLVFILDRLQKKDTYSVFSEPVDPKELPDYHEIIEHPMDFQTIRMKLDGGLYSDLEQFEADVFLICANAMQYNAPDTIYFRQARSIQELAKKDFENLRQESDDSDSQPKVVRRGRPPNKNLKKSIGGSPYERVGPDLISDATLATGEDNSLGTNPYNLRKGSSPYKFRAADAPVKASYRSRNNETCAGWLEGKNEFSVSILKGVTMKNGKKQFNVDENRRDTYNQSPVSALEHELSVLPALSDELKQLMVVGLGSEHSYARSLARFAANLGPVVWGIASKKIQNVLPAGLKFGPGWVGENEAPHQQLSPFYEKPKSSTNFVCDVHPSAPLGPSPSCSNSVLPNTSSLHGKVNMMERGVLNSRSELCSIDSSIRQNKPEASYQIQQKLLVHPELNGYTSGFGFNSPPHVGMVKQGGTSTGRCFSEGPSVPSQMLGMVSGSNTAPIGLMHAKHLDSGEPVSCGSIIGLHSANFPAPGFSHGSNTMPISGLNGKPSSQGFSPDLNVRFQSPGSPNSTVQIGSLKQPDLALQL
ncbi:uncharacterized protein LOC131162213 [Malania oleifera]|uniref:uncharacterized protein LOC131162213 n=1 Tax=Malania oleifera TaxID=397392 RepID=UPI0025AE3218|nr:uncharacterized protein LOC131162213 [Malania oleifera]